MLEDSLTEDVIISNIIPRIGIAIHMCNKNGLNQNEIMEFKVYEKGLKDFNYDGILEKMNAINSSGSKIKIKYRNAKINKILK